MTVVNVLLRLLVAALSGLALSGAFEPLAHTWMAPLAVAGLALGVHGLRARSAWLVGLVFGVAYFFTLQWWMRAVGPDAWFGLSALEAAFYAPLASAWAALQSRGRWWPWWCAVVWVAVESVRCTWPFSGMPWGRLSYSVADSVWAPGLPWLGFTGTSLLLCLLGTCLAALLLSPRRHSLTRVGVMSALLCATLLPWGVRGAYSSIDDGAGERAVVAVVQGDVPGAGDDLVSVHREVTDNHVRASVALADAVERGEVERPAFVVWPENSTAVDPFSNSRTRSGIEEAVRELGVPVLVGAMVDDVRDDRVLNQGVVWDPVTGPSERYTKWHPVPFGEYVPWRDLVFKQNLGRLHEVGRDMLSGDRTEPLSIAGIEVADAICFDVAYDDGIHAQVRNGAELLVVQTSNATFIHTDQVDQQYAITRLRALETGRSLAVASTNGISGIVGPDGSTIARAAKRSTETVVEEVVLRAAVTPAVRMDAWPGRLSVLASIVVLGGPLLSRTMAYIRRRNSRAPSPEVIT
ncbi:apolipoprotein N-acyltransferase [Nocardioides yefusunii]|uniref:Apolipoprotein N-acyltransferase n=1 Tax=Nocardioides yefusunii TaxID=2500546 RepID=A0ABW1QSK6_9ACTN|nr:apolipoprotein N-acyltransferase [Nocardioides yefusunii]